MLGLSLEDSSCEFCGGSLNFNQDETFKVYMKGIDLSCLNLTDVEDLLQKYLIYTCCNCGFKYKLTFKEIEINWRKKLTLKVMLLIAKGYISNYTSLTDKVLIYCGKCKGIDNQGSCPLTVYKKCELKRFPINGL